MIPKTRKEALAGGYTRYSTGVACVHGHIADRRAKTGECLTCRADFLIVWRKNNPDKVKKYQRITNLRKNFGLSIEDYEQMLIKQNNVCAICEKPETFIHHMTNEPAALAVDHCHKTNKVRQLLCRNCNSAIGLFHEDVKVMQNAINYLETHNG